MTSGFPRLKVIHNIDGHATEEVLEFAQAPYFLFDYDMIVVVEGTVIRSYEELVELASRHEYRGRKFLNVRMETVIAGG